MYRRATSQLANLRQTSAVHNDLLSMRFPRKESGCIGHHLNSRKPPSLLNLCYIYSICLFIYSVLNLHNSAKYIRHLNKVIIVSGCRSYKKLIFCLCLRDSLRSYITQ